MFKVFGSSVTDPHRIHPAVLAQIATTINHISGGNFILGIVPFPLSVG